MNCHESEYRSTTPETRYTIVVKIQEQGPDSHGAWDELCASNFNWITKRFRALMDSEDEADDLAQEFMLKLPEMLDSYEKRDGKRFHNWLSVCIRLFVNQHYRDRPREVPLGSHEGWANELMAPDDSWTEVLTQSVIRRREEKKRRREEERCILKEALALVEQKAPDTFKYAMSYDPKSKDPKKSSSYLAKKYGVSSALVRRAPSQVKAMVEKECNRLRAARQKSIDSGHDQG